MLLNQQLRGFCFQREVKTPLLVRILNKNIRAKKEVQNRTSFLMKYIF